MDAIIICKRAPYLPAVTRWARFPADVGRLVRG